MRIWRVRRVARFTCVMAEWWTRDRPARAAQSHVSAVALGADVFRFRGRRGGDDRPAVDRRSDADAGAPGEAGWWRNHHGIARGSRRRGDEDRWHRRFVLLDRP